jgi:hypothetical protein
MIILVPYERKEELMNASRKYFLTFYSNGHFVANICQTLESQSI